MWRLISKSRRGEERKLYRFVPTSPVTSLRSLCRNRSSGAYRFRKSTKKDTTNERGTNRNWSRDLLLGNICSEYWKKNRWAENISILGLFLFHRTQKFPRLLNTKKKNSILKYVEFPDMLRSNSIYKYC